MAISANEFALRIDAQRLIVHLRAKKGGGLFACLQGTLQREEGVEIHVTNANDDLQGLIKTAFEELVVHLQNLPPSKPTEVDYLENTGNLLDIDKVKFFRFGEDPYEALPALLNGQLAIPEDVEMSPNGAFVVLSTSKTAQIYDSGVEIPEGDIPAAAKSVDFKNLADAFDWYINPAKNGVNFTLALPHWIPIDAQSQVKTSAFDKGDYALGWLTTGAPVDFFETLPIRQATEWVDQDDDAARQAKRAKTTPAPAAEDFFGVGAGGAPTDAEERRTQILRFRITETHILSLIHI